MTVSISLFRRTASFVKPILFAAPKLLSAELSSPGPGDGKGEGQKERSTRGGRQDSSRMDKSEGAHSLQCGEENLLPSTEKKDAHSKISAQRIPKSGGAGGTEGAGAAGAAGRFSFSR